MTSYPHLVFFWRFLLLSKTLFVAFSAPGDPLGPGEEDEDDGKDDDDTKTCHDVGGDEESAVGNLRLFIGTFIQVFVSEKGPFHS